MQTTHRSLYDASSIAPTLLEVPTLKYLMIDGEGDPNDSDQFQAAMHALYSMAYGIKFARKKRGDGPDYKVSPVEGLWWSSDPKATSMGEDKSKWRWRLMIPQPNFIRQREVTAARRNLISKQEPGSKSDATALEAIRFEKWKEGPCVQIMHVGPYSAEGPTIDRLHDFAAQHGFGMTGKHHEIYLGDPRRARPDRLKTILRQPVVRHEHHVKANKHDA